MPDAETKYRAGALALTALAPGVTPFVNGRVGIGWKSEAGTLRETTRYPDPPATTA